MINKLISKIQVRLLEYKGNPSEDYKKGYIRAIYDVLDLEPIPTLGVDEVKKIKAELNERYEKMKRENLYYAEGLEYAISIIDKHIGK